MTSSIECRAHRRGLVWVATVAEHGLYGHGRTLKALRADIVGGLALLGVHTPVTVTAQSPELDELRSIDAARARALRAVVTTLWLRSATPTDIAEATGASVKLVKAILAENSEPATSADPAAEPVAGTS